MGDTGQPPGRPPPWGGGPQDTVPDQRATTAAWAVGSVSGGRNFAKIIEDEQRDRNILEMQITKIDVENENGVMTKPKPLTYEDLGEFLFDILEVNPADCVKFKFSSGRYDQREVKFKPGFDTSPYLRVTPIEFKNHNISVSEAAKNIQRGRSLNLAAFGRKVLAPPRFSAPLN